MELVGDVPIVLDPVMVAEELSHLEPARGGLFVDCTVGLGGRGDRAATRERRTLRARYRLVDSATGLVVVDTANFWSPFGHTVILALIQVGICLLVTAPVVLRGRPPVRRRRRRKPSSSSGASSPGSLRRSRCCSRSTTCNGRSRCFSI